MKYMNWSLLTDDILESLVLNQTELAELCKVSQQSISNWRSGIRNPGVEARSILRNLGTKAKLNLKDYQLIAPSKKKNTSAIYNNSMISDDLLDFANKLSTLPKKERNKIIDLAEFLMARN